MPRRKIAMRLIENARARAATYAKRTKGLQKKASELSTLCDVPVALVCAPAPGAGAGAARLVWESEEGVLDRYRGAAVHPHTRARRHTHQSYLEAELDKERAKLARARPGALADWDAALNDMTVDEAREVLETIDAALRAAGDRMVALGLGFPAVDEQVALAPDDDAFDNTGGVPQQLELEDMEYAGFQMQMVCHGGNNDGGGLLEQCLWDNRFPTQPGYRLECGGGGNYDVGAADETQAAAGYGNNADCSWPDLTMRYADDGSRGAALPADYYYYPKFVDGTLAPEYYSAQVVTAEDYIDTLPLQYPMDNSCTAQWQAEEFQPSDTNSSMDENYTYLDNSCTAQWQAEEFHPSDTNSSMDESYPYLDNSYGQHWQGEELQLSDTGNGQYQYQCSDPGTRSSSQVLHYAY